MEECQQLTASARQGPSAREGQVVENERERRLLPEALRNRRLLRNGLLGSLALFAGLACLASAAGAAPLRGRGRGRETFRHLGASVEFASEKCHTAEHGERCHTDVVYAMRNRMLHPEWYIGLDNCSSFEDFQNFMHKQVMNSGERRCPKPCKGKKGRGHGSILCEKEKGDTGCHTAVPGDPCYAHVLYTRKEARRYPRWYPGLSENSSMKDVQHYLEEEGVCPTPCGLKEGEDRVPGCHTALPGETCFQDIVMAKEHYIKEHPNWYAGLSKDSGRDDFQAFLHNQHHIDALAAAKACPLPCNAEAVDEANLKAQCKTATHGDDCYESVLYGATKGIVKHPSWYKGLHKNSSFEEFQLHLHGTNGTKCHRVPCPCHTAERGEKCYWSVLWVLQRGLKKFPETFEGLSEESSLQDIQMRLHMDGHSTCGRPCVTFDEDARAPWSKTFLRESETSQ